MKPIRNANLATTNNEETPRHIQSGKNTITTQVIVAGAGPVGMFTALKLAQAGLSVALVDAKPGHAKKGSKACVLQQSTLDYLDSVGLADAVEQLGIRWKNNHVYFKGSKIDITSFKEAGSDTSFINLPQCTLERLLHNKLMATELCSLLWSHRILDVRQSKNQVEMLVEGPENKVRIKGRFLLSCDGVDSPVRQLCGLSWSGVSSTDQVLVADIQAELPLEPARHIHFNAPSNPGRQIVIQPTGLDEWRIEWQLPGTYDTYNERHSGELHRRIRQLIGTIPFQLQWDSTRKCHHRIINQFRSGRIFFLGDAAHTFSPVSSLSLNFGLADANNLCWKLLMVMSGKAPAPLLDTYHAERYPITVQQLKLDQANSGSNASINNFTQWYRKTLFKLLSAVSFLQRYTTRMHLPVVTQYQHSPVIQLEKQHEMAGHYLPDFPIWFKQKKTRIQKLTGKRFILLCLCNDQSQARFVARQLVAKLQVLSPRTLIAVPYNEKEPEVPHKYLSVRYQPSSLAKRCPSLINHWVLVRPDGYIAWSHKTGHIDQIESCMKLALGDALSTEKVAQNTMTHAA